MTARTVWAWVVGILVLGCSADQEGDNVPSSRREAAATTAGEAPAVTSPSGPIDQALADQGESLFQSKGCIGCHTIGGGRLTGPDLKGITDRREFGWMVAMITNPDSMLKTDSTARRLFGEYMTPMMNMGVTQDEVRAIYEHLRRNPQ